MIESDEALEANSRLLKEILSEPNISMATWRFAEQRLGAIIFEQTSRAASAQSGSIGSTLDSLLEETGELEDVRAMAVDAYAADGISIYLIREDSGQWYAECGGLNGYGRTWQEAIENVCRP